MANADKYRRKSNPKSLTTRLLKLFTYGLSTFPTEQLGMSRYGPLCNVSTSGSWSTTSCQIQLSCEDFPLAHVVPKVAWCTFWGSVISVPPSCFFSLLSLLPRKRKCVFPPTATHPLLMLQHNISAKRERTLEIKSGQNITNYMKNKIDAPWQ